MPCEPCDSDWIRDLLERLGEDCVNRYDVEGNSLLMTYIKSAENYLPSARKSADKFVQHLARIARIDVVDRSG